jgi:hypothetical protein
MKMKLSTGKEIEYGIGHLGPNHILATELLNKIKALETELRDTRRELDRARFANTVAWVKVKGKEFRVSSDCSLTDNFSRRTGRRLAASKLVGTVNGELTGVEKQELFLAICPLKKKASKKELGFGAMPPQGLEYMVGLTPAEIAAHQKKLQENTYQE